MSNGGAVVLRRSRPPTANQVEIYKIFLPAENILIPQEPFKIWADPLVL
jgi:hypothetical protein